MPKFSTPTKFCERKVGLEKLGCGNKNLHGPIKSFGEKREGVGFAYSTKVMLGCTILCICWNQAPDENPTASELPDSYPGKIWVWPPQPCPLLQLYKNPHDTEMMMLTLDLRRGTHKSKRITLLLCCEHETNTDKQGAAGQQLLCTRLLCYKFPGSWAINLFFFAVRVILNQNAYISTYSAL